MKSEQIKEIADRAAEQLVARGHRRASTSKQIRETEAESTAFVVCHAVGLETGSAASDYIQLWNGDVRILPKASVTSSMALRRCSAR